MGLRSGISFILRSSAVATVCAAATNAQVHPAVGQNHAPAAEHVDQQALNDMVLAGLTFDAFITAFDMGDALLGVAARFGDRAMDNDLEFGFYGDGIQATILGDPELFGEAFENLLDNALVQCGFTKLPF